MKFKTNTTERCRYNLTSLNPHGNYFYITRYNELRSISEHDKLFSNVFFNLWMSLVAPDIRYRPSSSKPANNNFTYY